MIVIVALVMADGRGEKGDVEWTDIVSPHRYSPLPGLSMLIRDRDIQPDFLDSLASPPSLVLFKGDPLLPCVALRLLRIPKSVWGRG